MIVPLEMEMEIIYILHFPPGLTTPEQELLAKYFLSRILDTGAGGGGGVQVRQILVPDPNLVMMVTGGPAETRPGVSPQHRLSTGTSSCLTEFGYSFEFLILYC